MSPGLEYLGIIKSYCLHYFELRHLDLETVILYALFLVSKINTVKCHCVGEYFKGFQVPIGVNLEQ